jgi:hypothetical protein
VKNDEGAVKNDVAAVARKKETQAETQFTTKIGGKTSLGPSSFFPFVKFSFPVMRLMPYYAAETGRSCPLIV